MTALARGNGWRGFDGVGEKVERGGFGHPPDKSGWLYPCDGMPRLMGCGEEMIVTRRLSRVGEKSTGWLVTYGQCFPDETADDKHGNDLDVVLTFCPSCAEVVKRQDATREATGGAERPAEVPATDGTSETNEALREAHSNANEGDQA